MVIAIATWHGVTVHTNIGSSVPAAQKYRQAIFRLFSEPTTGMVVCNRFNCMSIQSAVFAALETRCLAHMTDKHWAQCG